MILLPGLGADGRSYEAQRAAIPGLIAPSWPLMRPGESLGSYAELVASRLPLSDSTILGGSSFGGMVALEIAARVPLRAVLLIGSCTSPRELARWARWSGLTARVAPALLFRPPRSTLPIIPELRRMSADQRKLAWDMVTASAPSFLRWGIGAVLGWRPSPLPPSLVVRHIHGSRDTLIPLSGVRPTRIVESGGHLLTLTHSEQVNAFLLEAMEAMYDEEPGEA